MARLRLSRLAQADISNVLAESLDRWGAESQRRYAALLTAALQRIAADPEGPLTRDRAGLLPGVRSLHMRHVLRDAGKPKTRRPVHIIYYRALSPDLIGILRVLHERSEPSRHITS